MAKLGSKKRPITVRANSEATIQYVAATCKKHGWYYIIGLEPDKPEDLSDLQRMLNPTGPVQLAGKKIGRNDPCSCGSGKKYKKCCGAAGMLVA